MRAKEFVFEAGSDLGSALKSIIAQRAQAASTSAQQNPNATKSGISGQGAVGSSIPAQTGQSQIKNTSSSTNQANQIGTPDGTQLGKPAPNTVAPKDVGSALSPGQMVDIPGVGKAKISKQTPQGIEIDTSQISGLGVPKITINPKDLMK
jgi:hypothetical protein